MRKFILFTVLTVCSLGIMAQVVPTVKMVPLKQNGKYGFKMNDKTVIPVQYDTVTCFYPCRLAIVKKGDKEFAIDVNGKKVSQDFANLLTTKMNVCLDVSWQEMNIFHCTILILNRLRQKESVSPKCLITISLWLNRATMWWIS